MKKLVVSQEEKKKAEEQNGVRLHKGPNFPIDDIIVKMVIYSLSKIKPKTLNKR